MKTRNTTRPFPFRQHETLASEPSLAAPMSMARGLRFEIIGLHYADVGPEWSSQGRAECDALHHINLVCSGTASVTLDGKELKLRPGQAYWFPGNTPMIRQCSRRYEVLYLMFRCEWHPGIDLLLDWPKRRPVCLGAWNQKEWQTAWRTGRPPTANTCLRLQSQLGLWISQAVPDLDKIISRHLQIHARFKDALSHIGQHLGARLLIADVAKAHGTTLHAFSLAFARALGLSPKAYVNRCLNEAIIRQLINTGNPLKQIAAELGFADEQYFSRFFTKMNGVPPARYRQRLLSGY